MCVWDYGLFVVGSNLLHKVCIRDLLATALYKNTLRCDAVFNSPAEDYGCVFFIELHHTANAVHLLTRHHRASTAAEGIQNDGVLLCGVADGITEQVERL